MTYPARYWTDPRVRPFSSPIQGSGGIATTAIQAGEPVQIIGGELMTAAEFAAYTAVHATYNAIQVAEDFSLVDTATTLDVSLNHSCDSNLWLADAVTLVARRDIAPGEELTVDYSLLTDDPSWQLDLPCNCSSPHCRCTITGADWQLPDLQHRYKGHFSPFLNARIAHLATG